MCARWVPVGKEGKTPKKITLILFLCISMTKRSEFLSKTRSQKSFLFLKERYQRHPLPTTQKEDSTHGHPPDEGQHKTQTIFFEAKMEELYTIIKTRLGA